MHILLHSTSIVVVPLESELLADIHLMRGDAHNVYEGTVSFVAKRIGTNSGESKPENKGGRI